MPLKVAKDPPVEYSYIPHFLSCSELGTFLTFFCHPLNYVGCPLVLFPCLNPFSITFTGCISYLFAYHLFIYFVLFQFPLTSCAVTLAWAL